MLALFAVDCGIDLGEEEVVVEAFMKPSLSCGTAVLEEVGVKKSFVRLMADEIEEVMFLPSMVCGMR